MKKAVIGIIIGSIAAAAAAGAGLFVYGREEIKQDTVEIREFSELTVDATSADIILKQGSENKISYRLPESLVPNISEDGGKLNITSKPGKNRLFHINFGSGRTYIEITVTADTLEKAKIDVTSGDIEANGISITGSISATSGDISLNGSDLGQDLSVHTTSGDLSFSDCVFGNLDCDQTSGDIKLKNVQCAQFSSETTSGDISGELDAEAVSLNATSGDIGLLLAGTENDYSIDCSCTVGDITLSGEDQGSRCRLSPDDAERTFSAETTSGDITLSFAG